MTDPTPPLSSYDEALRKAEQVDPTTADDGLVFISVANVFEPMLPGGFPESTDEQMKRIRWEYCLFLLGPQCSINSQLLEYTDEALEYFRERLYRSENPILRARYAEVLWDRRKDALGIPSTEKASAARVAAESYVEIAVNLRNQALARVSTVNCYERAVELSLELNDEELLRRICGGITDTANVWLSVGDTKLVPCLVDVLLSVRKTRSGRTILADGALRMLADSIYALAQPRVTWAELELARPLLHVLSEIEAALGNQQTALRYLDEEAETWEIQVALVPHGAGWFRAGWYEKAADLYRKTGNRAKLGEMMTKMQGADNESVTKGEFKSVAIQVDVPAEELSQIWSKYTSGPDLNACLATLATDDDLLPSHETCKQEARDAQAQPSLLNMISKAVYKNGRRVLHARTQDEKLELSANESMRFCTVLVVRFVVAPVLAALRKKGSLTETSLVEFLESRGHLATESKPLLRQGVHHYFQNQFVAALYILVPLLERTIRDICVRDSIDITPPRAGGYKAKTLDTMLTMPEVERLLGNRVRDYLRFVLCGEAEGAMNLRNDVAHGFLRAEECSQEKADLVLFITLVLSRFNHQPGPAVVDSAEPPEGHA